jgi:predicted MPP superfamily phosphohydrolase
MGVFQPVGGNGASRWQIGVEEMTLRDTHTLVRFYDGLAIATSVLALIVVWASFSASGAWVILGWLSLIGVGLIAWGTFVEPQRLRILRRREALVSHPTTWIKIVFLSDFHAGGPRPAKWYERLAREASALNPDVLLLGGDFVVDRSDPITMLAPFTVVSARMGKYFVLGNHDFMDQPHVIREALQRFGCEDLTNRSVFLSRDGKELELTGIDDHWYGDPKLALRKSKEVPRFLLSHEPDVLMDLEPGQVDYVIAGHTHGGQVALPLIGPLRPIPAKLGRKVSDGLRNLYGTPCFISEGCGEADARFRLFTYPEIVVIEVGI